MRWLSFGPRGGERPGILVDDETVLDVAVRWPHWPRNWCGLLAEGLDREAARALAAGDFAGHHLRRRRDLLLAPPVPDPTKVIAVGRNYPSHAAEQRRAPSETPLLFAKAPSCLVGDGAEVIVPPFEGRPDYEAEMALVIGRVARDLPADRAREAIAGVTAINDVSGREAQFGDRQWFRGKSFDTFGPVGPWVVSLDAIGNPDDLGLRMLLNGDVRQAARTSEMTFGCAALVAWISAQLTLLPGDLIATGTPAGVGVFRDPPTFLQDGDRMEVDLEGVGTLRNRVRRPAR